MLGEHDVKLEHRQVISLLIELNGNLIKFNFHVFADHFQNVLLHLWQIIRGITLAALVGHNDLLSFFRQFGAALGLF